MQCVDSPEVSQYKPTPSTNYQSEDNIRDKNVNFYCLSAGKYVITFIILTITICVIGMLCYKTIVDVKTQNIIITQFSNSLSALFVSIATFFGLQNKK